MENIDIKALARELKRTAAKKEASKSEESDSINKMDSSPGGKPKKAGAKTKSSSGSSSLQSIVEAANERDDFLLTNQLYIDTDIYDILRQLKTRTRLVIGNLASVLLEEFIKSHKAEIIKLLKPKPNRLMK